MHGQVIVQSKLHINNQMLLALNTKATRTLLMCNDQVSLSAIDPSVPTGTEQCMDKM